LEASLLFLRDFQIVPLTDNGFSVLRPKKELPVIGQPNWYLLSLLSPYAGIYYWRSGDRVDDVQVKLEANDEETQNEITVLGSEEEMERMWRTLEWTEKGMVKVEGLLS
jgi:Cofactor assembly of complex C subunit B